MLFLTACLLGVLAIYAGLRVLHRLVVLLELDPWDALVWLGLAERVSEPDVGPMRPRRRRLA